VTIRVVDHCPMCGKRRPMLFRLRDVNGEAEGEYCSRDCAVADAWGPRFKKYNVRKIRGRV
jgi:hypothetical protein